MKPIRLSEISRKKRSPDFDQKSRPRANWKKKKKKKKNENKKHPKKQNKKKLLSCGFCLFQGIRVKIKVSEKICKYVDLSIEQKHCGT